MHSVRVSLKIPDVSYSRMIKKMLTYNFTDTLVAILQFQYSSFVIKSVEIYLKQAMFTTKSTIRTVGNGIPTHVEFRLKELEPVYSDSWLVHK